MARLGKVIRHKFNAQPSVVDGIRFQSKKEKNYYETLKQLQLCIRMIVNGNSHYREQIFSRRGDILPNCSR